MQACKRKAQPDALHCVPAAAACPIVLTAAAVLRLGDRLTLITVVVDVDMHLGCCNIHVWCAAGLLGSTLLLSMFAVAAPAPLSAFSAAAELTTGQAGPRHRQGQLQ